MEREGKEMKGRKKMGKEKNPSSARSPNNIFEQQQVEEKRRH
jgi:hypothetical protein